MFSNQLLFHCTGTSNWSENYFTNTAGVGLIIKQNSTNLQRRQRPVQEQLKDIFERDWNSKYAVNLEDVQGQKDCNWGADPEVNWNVHLKQKQTNKQTVWILFMCKSRNYLLFVFVREITSSWHPHWWHENFWLLTLPAKPLVNVWCLIFCVCDYLTAVLMKCIQCCMTSCLALKANIRDTDHYCHCHFIFGNYIFQPECSINSVCLHMFKHF